MFHFHNDTKSYFYPLCHKKEDIDKSSKKEWHNIQSTFLDCLIWNKFAFASILIILDSCDWIIFEITRTVCFYCCPYKNLIENSTSLL